MKKIFLSFMFIGAMTLSFAGNGEDKNENKTETVEFKGGKLTIVNDTDTKYRIHTGFGETTLNPRGGKTTVTCSPGKTVKADGKAIFKVTDDMCGETIKLSEYL